MSSSWCRLGLAGLAALLIAVELGDWVVFWSKERAGLGEKMLSVYFK